MIHQEQDSRILFEEFLQEKTFLSNLALKTLFLSLKFQGVFSTFPLTGNQADAYILGYADSHDFELQTAYEN